jgi:phage terminase large subunit-like protein
MAAKLHPAERYIRDVLNGKIAVCKWVRLACERHVNDLKTAKRKGFYFDRDAAIYAEDFFAQVLTHPKAAIHAEAGEPFLLEPWELAMIIWPLYGWKRKDGTRRYRRAYIEIPKKNGKSSLSAGLALEALFADNELSAEVFSVAGSRDQAALVFNIAKVMTETSPLLLERAEAFRNVITYKDTYSAYRVISADAPHAHGINASCIVFDEMHTQPNRLLFDALWGAGKARKQPLFIMLTTAGYDRQSVCFEMHQYAQEILDGVREDDSFWSVIYTIDEGDDWTSPKVWKKANPNIGVTIGLDAVAEEAKQAKAIAGYQNTFKRLTLNVWTEQETRLITAEQWNECQSAATDLEAASCWGGLDLASSNDIAAFVLNFPSADGETHRWLPFFWIPEENMLERSRQHGVNYDAWVRDGYMRATPGNVIDLKYIKAEIEQLGQIYKIKQIAYDRWGAREISQDLQDMGFEMVEFGQGFRSMAAPTKEFLRLVASKKLQHDGHPVLRWMANNIVAKSDEADNLKPDKQKSKEKIDGIVAGIMALDMALRNTQIKASVYETRGVLRIGDKL